MKASTLSFVLLSLIALVSCSPPIHKAPGSSTTLSTHKTVAILPADVILQLRPNQARKLEPEQIDELTHETAYEIQEKIYNWLIRRSKESKFTVNFQDIELTNKKLKDAGITYKKLRVKNHDDLAQILGVDAVIQDRILTAKPMSAAAAITFTALTGVSASSTFVHTTINIYDGKSGEILWQYDYEGSGLISSSPAKLVDGLMRNASKNFPYSAK